MGPHCAVRPSPAEGHPWLPLADQVPSSTSLTTLWGTSPTSRWSQWQTGKSGVEQQHHSAGLMFLMAGAEAN